MTSQLNHYAVQQRQIESAFRAEHVRLVNEARRARPTSRSRSLGGVLAMRRSTAAKLTAGFGPADSSPSPASVAERPIPPALRGAPSSRSVCTAGANPARTNIPPHLPLDPEWRHQSCKPLAIAASKTPQGPRRSQDERNHRHDPPRRGHRKPLAARGRDRVHGGGGGMTGVGLIGRLGRLLRRVARRRGDQTLIEWPGTPRRAVFMRSDPASNTTEMRQLRHRR